MTKTIKNTFEKREKDKVTWLSAVPLEQIDGIVQGFSTRLGGERRLFIQYEPQFFQRRSKGKGT